MENVEQTPGALYKRQCEYDRYRDAYACPRGQELPYGTAHAAGYREYKSDPNQCRQCEARTR